MKRTDGSFVYKNIYGPVCHYRVIVILEYNMVKESEGWRRRERGKIVDEYSGLGERLKYA